MGLVSLPYLNRVGNYVYWNNVWDNISVYRTYLFLEMYLNFFFFRFFEDLTFNYILNFFKIKNKKSKSGYLAFVRDNFNVDSHIYMYLGRIWLFMYQNWYIIKVSILLPSRDTRKNIVKTVNFFKLNKLFLKNFTSVKYVNKYAYMNYKYKI